MKRVGEVFMVIKRPNGIFNNLRALEVTFAREKTEKVEILRINIGLNLQRVLHVSWLLLGTGHIK